MPFNYNITIDEPSTVTRTQDTYVYQALNDALSAWSKFLNGNGVLNVHVSISGLGGSSSTAGTHIAQAGPTAVTPNAFDPNAVVPTVIDTSGAYALRTGQHITSSDIDITFNSAFLPVTGVRQSIDLVAVFEHELMHGFGLVGYRTSAAPVTGPIESKWDQLVTGTNQLYFTGPEATYVYGGYVPVTTGLSTGSNYYHVGAAGNASDPAILRGDLIYPIDSPGRAIGALDVAILGDIGVPLSAAGYALVNPRSNTNPVTSIGSGAVSEPVVGGTALTGQPVATMPIVPLHGNHGDYVIANNDGQLYVRDLVSGRDGEQTVANPGEIHFADGIGVFDKTGNAEVLARVYQAAFGRAPDAPGLEYIAPRIDSGSVNLAQVADSFLASTEYQNHYGTPDTNTFVRRMYQNILHRTAAPSEEAFVQEAITYTDNHGRGASLVALSDSQENHRLTVGTAGDKTDAQATRLYQAAFNRAPDASGVQFTVNALKNGAPGEGVALGFANSAEFQQTYGRQNNGDFVATLYRNVLHREADVGGKLAYTQKLDAGYSRGYALFSLAESLENRVSTAGVTHDAWVFVRA